MKYFISKNYRHLNSAGDKAKTDIEAVMLGLGFRPCGLAQSRFHNAILAYLRTTAGMLIGVSRLRRGDTLVVQYPFKKYYRFIVDRAVKKGCKVITLIHDLGSFRRKKLSVDEEIRLLNRSSVVIVHSKAMQRWLAEHGLTVPTVVLGLFDYLSESHPRADAERGPQCRLAFAGNVSPQSNGWVYRLAEAVPAAEIVLYGGGLDATHAQGLQGRGYVASDDIIAGIEGNYGVVWYGASIDEGAGSLGEYLQYNAPHKASLYLRAGLPLIVWSKSALAEIVSELGIGICVDSLRDIDRRLAEVSDADYARMQENVNRVAARLAEGKFATAALEEALAIISSAP